MRLPVKDETAKLLEDDVIEPTTSGWASAVVLVPKKDVSLHFCVDYRRLDTLTRSDASPLPRMRDCIDSLGEAATFSTHDCNAGYWQVPIARADRDKTTFTSYLGIFRYKRMPFGLKNASTTFQHASDVILSGVCWQICLVPLDDEIAFSRSTQKHIKQLHLVLTLLRRSGVSLKVGKCHFAQSRVDYHGHVISSGTLAMAQRCVDSIKKFEFPKSLTQLSFFWVTVTSTGVLSTDSLGLLVR